MGFDLAINRLTISIKNLTLAVIFNISLTMIVLYLLTKPFSNIYYLLSIFIYSLFAILGGILTFKHLFQGRIKLYVILMLINSLLHLSIIPLITRFNFELFYFFPLITFLWFLVGFRGFVKYNKVGNTHLAELYKLGTSTFIINSAVSLALVADKYLINHNLALVTANAYTFSWGLVVPLLYFGNLVEKIIYGSSTKQEKNLIIKSLLLLFILVTLYSSAITLIVNFLPTLLPKSIDYHQLRNIFNFMIVGYGLFVIFNFPINGYLFKFAETYKQKKTAISFLVLLISFPLIFIAINGGTQITDYKMILITIWIFIFLLLIIKTIIVFKPAIIPLKISDE